MKKNISFKLFCTVVWRGFCQGIRALARLFGYQGTDRYLCSPHGVILNDKGNPVE